MGYLPVDQNPYVNKIKFIDFFEILNLSWVDEIEILSSWAQCHEVSVDVVYVRQVAFYSADLGNYL